MKKILLSLFPMLLMASQSDLNSKIEKLQHDLQTLQQEVKYHQDDLDERIPIIEAVEKKSILDKINLSPEIRLRFDKFNYTNGMIGETADYEDTQVYDKDGNPTLSRRDEYSKNFDVASSIRFRLNMNATFDDVKFHGRLLYMNSSQSHQRICILSRDIKSGTSGSAFDVDRAYIDYIINAKSQYPFTLSFGLLPTTGGTPMQYAQDTQRSSLFPALVFDMNTYGVIGTQQLGEETFARIVLARPYTLRANFYPYQCNRENIDHADIAGIYADTKFHFLGDSLLSFGVNMLHDLKAHPYMGPDISASDAHILGSMLTFGLGLDIEKVANTPTTLFLHTALSNPHANGEQDDYRIVTPVEDELTEDGRVGFTTADYASGEMLQENGYSIYLGAKYAITPTLFVGAEYNYGSKYWFSATQGADDMFNKLATRGNVYELYSTWQFHRYLNAKLSFLDIHESYTGSGWHFGTPAKKDADQDIVSFALEAKF